MKSTRYLILMASCLGLFALGGCSKLENANGGKGYAGKADTAAWAGNGGTFSAGGWTPGDKKSWEAELKKRSMGQNEYTRTPARDTASAK